MNWICPRCGHNNKDSTECGGCMARLTVLNNAAAAKAFVEVGSRVIHRLGLDRSEDGEVIEVLTTMFGSPRAVVAANKTTPAAIWDMRDLVGVVATEP